jgi:hypothetical protein
MTAIRKREDKPRIVWSINFGGHWKALSAWDLNIEDNETWKLNLAANQFCWGLNARRGNNGCA